MIPRSMKLCVGMSLTALAPWLAPTTVAAQTPASPTLSVVGSTLVDGVPNAINPFAMIGNLDGVGVVAGRTSFFHNGVLFPETHATFSWSETSGMLIADLTDEEYFDAQTHVPTDISPAGTVVGWAYFTDRVDQQPLALTPGYGFTFLPVPRTAGGPPGSRIPFQGFAYGVSDDGRVAVGTVQEGPFSDVPTLAASWTFSPRGPRLDWGLKLLDTSDVYSNARQVNADGSVIVGDSGPSREGLTATRWVNGSQQILANVGTTSTARLTSVDGSIAVGWATVNGANVLVTWDALGNASVFVPPVDTQIEKLNAITPDGSAVVGVLSAPDPAALNSENWAPFVWSTTDGFVVIPEAGLEDEYDRSQAFDVTDHGTMVVGQLKNGNPTSTAPTLGFIWTRSAGLYVVNDLLADSDLTYPTVASSAYAVAGDGSRVLVTGDATTSSQDTNAVILDLIQK